MTVYLFRHGETEWSRSGQHTGRTDLPLTENGRLIAARIRAALAGLTFAEVLVSPLSRARDTCALAGLENPILEPDLLEWDYGEYEGLTSHQIAAAMADWSIFRHGARGGETPAEVAARADRVVARLRAATGHVAVFAHGHILRVLAARWIGLPPTAGENFLLDTATLCQLGDYRGQPAIRIWNAPLPASS